MKRRVMPLLLVLALVVGLFPVSALAQDTASDMEEPYAEPAAYEEEPVCEHADTEVFYDAIEDWVHAVTVLCSCGEEVDWFEETCLDDDCDLICDLCEGELSCLHPYAAPYYDSVTDWIHSVTQVCDCGEEIDWYEEACQDADGDLVCDLCAGALTCRHEDTQFTCEPGEEERTHVVVETCACGEELARYAEDCLDADHDLFCDGCECDLPCLHGEVTVSAEPGEEAWTHTAAKVCVCGEELDRYEEACPDEDGDLVCDLCKAELPCLHGDTAVTYQPGRKEETHIAVTLCSCGEEVDAVVESCEDTDRDGLCDGCDAQMQEPITLGDVNFDGIIDEADAGYILNYVARMEEYIDEAMADVDGDGCITALDAMLILCYVQGQIDSFPAQQKN